LLSRIKWCESGTDFDFCIGCRTAWLHQQICTNLGCIASYPGDLQLSICASHTFERYLFWFVNPPYIIKGGCPTLTLFWKTEEARKRHWEYPPLFYHVTHTHTHTHTHKYWVRLQNQHPHVHQVISLLCLRLCFGALCCIE
jgi:hypothetical protein